MTDHCINIFFPRCNIIMPIAVTTFHTVFRFLRCKLNDHVVSLVLLTSLPNVSFVTSM